MSGLALRFARALPNPFLWVDVRDPEHPPTEEELRVYGAVPERGRVEVTRSADLAPDDSAANSALWAGAPKDGESSRVVDFLRVPSLIRDLVKANTPDEGDVTLVVANADRLGELYPDQLEGTRAWVRTLAENRVGLVVTCSGAIRSDRMAFDHVLRLEAVDGTDGPQWVVEVERNTGGLLDAVEGTRRPLRNLPFPEH